MLLQELYTELSDLRTEKTRLEDELMEARNEISEMQLASTLQCWEPGSEPPEGWYWVEYGGDEKCIAYYGGCTLEFIGGDSTEWTRETLSGPIPEPEVSE